MNCLASFPWRVYQHGRFVGYINSFTYNDAYRKAKDKYGNNIRIEKVSLAPSSNG